MNIRDLSDFLEGELTYPIDQASVIDQIGTIEIDAPNIDDTELISEIIDRVGEETYDSPAELFETIIGNLNDDYIGRKFYDDRGGNPLETEAESVDHTDTSF